jgi:hypothetical protein
MVYALGFVGAVTYFNWTYARDNGFMKWLILGQVVPTAKAVVWPYFVVARASSPEARRAAAPQQMPRSIQNFLFSLDALARANSSDVVGDPPDASRVFPLLQEVVDSAASVDREVLNRLYPSLGDHFFNDAVGTARLYLEARQLRDRDRITRAMAAWLRWTNWYNVNITAVVGALRREYGLDIR